LIEIDTPENEAKIDRLYAFMSVDDEGRNGIVASILPNLGSTPLVTGSRRVALKMIPMAEAIAKATGKKIILYVFTRAESYDLWRSDEDD
jgi:hypothetical protein